MEKIKVTLAKNHLFLRFIAFNLIIFLSFALKIHAYATEGNLLMTEDQSENISDIQDSTYNDIPYIKESTLPSLHVNGSTIYNEMNEEIIFCGLCCGTSTRITSDWANWYNDQTFKTIKSWGVNVFRITLKPDQYVNHPDYINLLCNYIDLCVDNNLYVIVTWMGNRDYLNYSAQAASFFTYLSIKYMNCNNIIYEVCNEPFQSSWNAINEYATSMIDIIRTNSPNAMVAVPAPYPTTATGNNIDSFLSNPINRENVIYTVHMYVGGQLNDTTLNALSLLSDNNIPLLISEWGTTLANGRDGFFEEKSLIWLDYLKDRRIGWINFNLSDVYWNNTPYNSSVVKMGEWNSYLEDNILSPSGFFIKHYILGDYASN